MTINPAIAHGISDYVGSVEIGKLADLVLWKPGFFGVKPDLVIKGGSIVWSQMGDPNASIPTPQPVHGRPMFGTLGNNISANSLTFLSKEAMEVGIPDSLELKRKSVAVNKTRDISKRDMRCNDALPIMKVDPQTYEVFSDGELLTCEPSETLPMAQRYLLL